MEGREGERVGKKRGKKAVMKTEQDAGGGEINLA